MWLTAAALLLWLAFSAFTPASQKAVSTVVKSLGFVKEQKWSSTPAFPHAERLGLRKLLNPPKSHFVHLQCEANKNMYFTGLL